MAPFRTYTGNDAKFKDVDRLTNSRGICSVISQRRDGQFTFAVFKVFHKMGERGEPVEDKTSFFPEEMGEAYIDHIRLTLERMAQLRTTPQDLPFPLRDPGSR